MTKLISLAHTHTHTYIYIYIKSQNIEKIQLDLYWILNFAPRALSSF